MTRWILSSICDSEADASHWCDCRGVHVLYSMGQCYHWPRVIDSEGSCVIIKRERIKPPLLQNMFWHKTKPNKTSQALLLSYRK